MEKWVKSSKVYEGKVVTLRVGSAVTDNGRSVVREVVEHSGGVAILPVLDDSVILIRQFRIAIGRDLLEVPAGRLENDESPIYRAQRELEEETGYIAGKLVPVGAYFASVGYTTEKISMFLAFDLKDVGQKPEVDEKIQLVRFTLSEAREMLLNKEIEDSKTAICLHELMRYLDN